MCVRRATARRIGLTVSLPILWEWCGKFNAYTSVGWAEGRARLWVSLWAELRPEDVARGVILYSDGDRQFNGAVVGLGITAHILMFPLVIGPSASQLGRCHLAVEAQSPQRLSPTLLASFPRLSSPPGFLCLAKADPAGCVFGQSSCDLLPPLGNKQAILVPFVFQEVPAD